MSSGAGGSGDGSSEAFAGQLGLPDPGSDVNAHDFQIRQRQSGMRTMIPVKIVAVHGGGVDKEPTVDVQPLIKQMDGSGKTQSHGIVYGIPASRNRAGNSAIINDPRVGDMGMMSVADRDISSAKSSMQESNPGSFRRHSLSDGIYHGNLFNKEPPKQYIHFKDDGVDITDVNKNMISTSKDGISLNGVVIDRDGNVKAPGEMTAKSKGGSSVTVSGHKHPSTDKPTPGT
ncbi:hypothetical protein DA075_35565 (plasmid) [Methylobacterium currus]|uniref:Phage protein Gp138 N-terminal domain-containing protein n=1 Tax=Methylobacterium currus TaxID=2051553 RepID=A0A2R4WXE2_9HYPH|nr:Gp138 family membrane-puncturing spike protein [Methylobacterium currus]AWB26191.1 hypothetical protein DA075_35565 [Methylobacterium currus]